MRDVFVVQKKRYYMDGTRASAWLRRPLFARLELMPVFSKYLLECCKFVCNHPDYFQRTAEVQSHDTRHKPELFVGASTLQISDFTHEPCYVCAKIYYNALPGEIREIKTN